MNQTQPFIDSMTRHLESTGFTSLEIKGIVKRFLRLAEVASLEDAYSKTLKGYGCQELAEASLSDELARFATNAPKIETNPQKRLTNYANRFNALLSKLDVEISGGTEEQRNKIRSNILSAKNNLRINVKEEPQLTKHECYGSNSSKYAGLELIVSV